MANDINKEDPHYKGEYGSIYEVNRKFPTGGVAGDFVVIDGWAHYWNADRGTWCVNAERDSYWDELITNIIEKFKLVRGATYMDVASLDTVPTKVIGAKMYYFATVAGTYKNFGDLVVPQGINVLYSENGSSWVNTTLLEVAQELGVSTNKVVSQKTLNDALNLKANQSSVNEALAKKADNKRVDDELAKKFDKASVVQEFGDSEDKVVSQFALPFREIESPEFIKAIVDAEDHFLFGIQLDGSIEWGKGIPAPIRAKLQEIINKCQQDKTDILEAINVAKKELSASIAALQEGKVDKEKGKSLIEDEVKECFRVIENEEFIMAVVDSEDRLLFGFYRATGKPYYPLNDTYHISQSEEFLWVILDAVNHPLLGIQQDGTCWAAKAQWLDDIKAIKEALSSIDETLKTFQPKEDGKGLINLDVADSFFYISNDEYIIAVVDTENRILAGIKYDGEPYFPNHEIYSVIANEEWLYAIIDAEKKVLGGFRADDGHMIVGGIDISTFITNTIVDIADIKERTSHFSTIVNDEYLAVETDLEGKVIGYTSPDGSHYLYKVKSETIPTEFEHIEDPEGRTEITADAEGKVMSYRDSSGKKHEHDMEVTNLDVSNLNLQGNSVNNIQDALKANGFDVKTPIDWSDYLSNDGDNPLYIPEPRYAIINISGIDSMPTAKGVNEKAYFEMWDMQGNYFKKKVVMNAQGNTTMYFPKKSFACDFFDNDWNSDSFAIKIGDWVPQDSFHFKAQYTDFFKGISIVAYKLIQEVWASRSPIYSNPWKKALLSTINITSGSWNNNGVNDLSIQKDTGAKCIPDAFPCAVYLNGTFYGVFNWALKKHRDNYHLNKSLATNIHLDGGAYPMFSPLDWSKFEVRNPKGLITKSNETYDGDSPSELIDSTMEGYDASNKKHILSSKVKASIIAFNSYGRTLNSMTKENGGDEFLNEHFDLDNLIDFFVSQYVLADEDIENNWQWVTYDGIKWFVCDYDKDRTFGQTYNCPGVMDASKMINPNKVSNDNYPFKYLYNYHKDDIKKRYNELKSLGIFTPEHVISLVVNWFNRIPAADLKMEYKKWSESPSNRDDNVDREHWKIKEISYGYDSSYKEYDNSKTYQIGELCIYGKQQKALFECVKGTAGNPPITKFYANIPYDLGYHDSIWRVIKYITERFKNIENELNNI